MKEEITRMILPKAHDCMVLVEPLLTRSYDKWKANGRKELTSAYMSGAIIIITTTVDGKPHQTALLNEEIEQLPADFQPILKQRLAEIEKKGSTSFAMQM